MELQAALGHGPGPCKAGARAPTDPPLLSLPITRGVSGTGSPCTGCSQSGAAVHFQHGRQGCAQPPWAPGPAPRHPRLPTCAYDSLLTPPSEGRPAGDLGPPSPPLNVPTFLQDRHSPRGQRHLPASVPAKGDGRTPREREMPSQSETGATLSIQPNLDARHEPCLHGENCFSGTFNSSEETMTQH